MRLWVKVGTHPARHVTSTNKRNPRIGLILSVKDREAGAKPYQVRITDFRYIDGQWLYFMEML